ncbi:MAG TPA: malonyl-CoA synthase [Dongiaceae bacterium]|nr:malonyl-CoA synthase [Dongiaceae bacterium]
MNHLFEQFRRHIPGAGARFLELPDGTVVTYGDMLARSAHLAHALAARGVKPGDRVAVQVEKCPGALMLYLACVRAGAVFLPLNVAYTLVELDYFFADAEPRLVVCDPGREGDISPIATKVGAAVDTLAGGGEGSLNEIANLSDPTFADMARGPDDLAAILYTSGTTGRSKGAMLSHENLASNARVLAEAWRFTSADVLLHALPIFHTHGLFVATNVTLMAGCSMLFLPRFDVDEMLRLMPRASCMMGVPTFYTRLLQSPRLTREATAHMRLFVSGSAPLLADVHEQWRARTGHAILERYGMTETNMNTSNPYDGDRVAGTVGLPLSGVNLRVSDPETGTPLPQGEIGMIEVKGPNVFRGYWRMPEKTKAEFRPDNFFITGDLGKIDDRGYIHIVGREKDLVISGGYNVYPKEVENEIDAIAGVLESAVVGIPHPDLGEGVVAVVVKNAGSSLTEGEVQRSLDGRLAKFKQPKRVFFVEDLPRNTMGKVQKSEIRRQYGAVFGKGR